MASISKTLPALLLAAGAAAVLAAPEIKFDNMTYKGGNAAEGSILKAQFKLTNTGDDTLRITDVRPGCGCTVVSYDSVIAPGKSGLIKPEVNLKGFHSGPMSRGVTVTSNAASTPRLSLTIEATVVASIELSQKYIDFESAAKQTLILASAKKDLKVSGVVFKPQHGGQNVPAWAANTPLKVKFAFAPHSSTREDGLKSYKLDLDTPGDGKEAIEGTFEITTNHPDKKDISVAGRVK
jgi:hypothetical protein